MQDDGLKTVELRSVVGYQEEAVVSRELMKSSGGGVTVFAFDEGTSLSEHTVPFDAFVYIIEGEALIRIENESFRPTEGESMIMPANKAHSVRAEKRFKMLLAMNRA